ncbi:gluconokinase [Rhodococcus sp. BP-349]|nr:MULTISPECIES: gluconokinase [unclassified Rhodococcus (in: high G+C Gram-positive bacteria)]MBY6537051.1 gluconokinase [Rhodococcus sp. BP-363]MBY6541388.1 gluconokinase [Rhodococcus sp. BP-369]MBY6560618.1 gluconokinase [Rhodococcus sp. BP-370]MBY6574910.1 gluconokinase [Rhodococcus sp. BP-364]MBY6584211.1 gluconokinase [Rhodococcus sp. BP-358]
MGVSGTGKTTVGSALATTLGSTFIEGDTFHPKANIDKMSAGHPLNDDDRRPWLTAVAREIERVAGQGGTSVTACSALTRLYRDWLRTGFPDLFFVHLQADYDTLLDRMSRRKHFMPPSLLQSQFDTLEDLQTDEPGAGVPDVDGVQKVVAAALTAVGATR